MSNYTMPQFLAVKFGRIVRISIYDLIKEQLILYKNAIQQQMKQYGAGYNISIYNYTYHDDHIHIKLRSKQADDSLLEITLEVDSLFLHGDMEEMLNIVSEVGVIIKDKETLSQEEVEQIKSILLEHISEPFLQVDYTK